MYSSTGAEKTEHSSSGTQNKSAQNTEDQPEILLKSYVFEFCVCSLQFLRLRLLNVKQRISEKHIRIFGQPGRSAN